MKVPDYGGSILKAWKLTTPPDHPTSLGDWLVFAPGVHAAWRYHVVSLIHLRPVEGVPVAKLNAPISTHEVLVLAVDPNSESTLDPDQPGTIKCMTGPEISVQIAVADDDVAYRIAHRVIQRCVAGILIPDSDFKAQWKAQLRDLAIKVKV